MLASNILSDFTNFVVTNKTALFAGGAFLTTKAISAFSEYSKNKKEIRNKDLYFYYQAGKLLEK